jgi:uncharacterized protein YacL
VIALRPEVQPGDELQLKVVRDGKEAEQGVGYLDDGTMVVVEGARGRQGERLAVVITGALQNPTGRIVFARLEGANAGGEKGSQEKGSQEKMGTARTERPKGRSR